MMEFIGIALRLVLSNRCIEVTTDDDVGFGLLAFLYDVVKGVVHVLQMGVAVAREWKAAISCNLSLASLVESMSRREVSWFEIVV